MPTDGTRDRIAYGVGPMSWTRLIFRGFRNTARVIRNAVSENVVEIERGPEATFEDIKILVAGVIPFVSFLAERWVNRKVLAREKI